MASFLVEVIGLTPATVASLRDSPIAEDSLGIVEATLAREARALTTVDLDRLAQRVAQPVLLMLGTESPGWAETITHHLSGALPDPILVTLDGSGHEGVATHARRVSAELTAFVTR
jgi:pimeloyl-ACP methyl ester carboxylesterase